MGADILRAGHSGRGIWFWWHCRRISVDSSSAVRCFPRPDGDRVCGEGDTGPLGHLASGHLASIGDVLKRAGKSGTFFLRPRPYIAGGSQCFENA